ncbi:MAG TPA: lytic murein transglycosylase [Candidatus Paceibacterota bacterium]|jgi:membrane-bound lytic murein transglycosylase B|nr:lytic murein transglycosylase [Candidatus Paceibacterota bacterium]HRS47708.1 lytic murein transglycosylase [Candidatus Paceibacterota bacterium]
MRNRSKFIVVLLIVIMALSYVIQPSFVFSQTKEELEQQLAEINRQIAQYEAELKQTQSQKTTLTNKINQLKKEQSKIELQIKSTNLQISQLETKIENTRNSLQATEKQLAEIKNQISQNIQLLDEKEQQPLLITLLSKNNLSDLFFELQSLNSLSDNLTSLLKNLEIIKIEYQEQQQSYEAQQEDAKNLLAIKTLQQKDLSSKANEQAKILEETKGKEAAYQAMLADSKKKAEQIRNRIYELLGVGKQISFGEAVEVANWASSQTGIRPAFLLAILTQESDLGKNIGQCYLKDPLTGDGVGKNTGRKFERVMNPKRDVPIFLQITKELGLDPYSTQVSCPMSFGWGGAMGPAQFIPSTWQLYKTKLSSILGKTPNPWDIRDSFLAAALLLKDNGAKNGDVNSEWKAAMLYFSGSLDPKYSFYGDNVMAIAEKYQQDINTLNKNK